MNTDYGKLLSGRICAAALMAVLLLVPIVSQAQPGNTATGTNALASLTTGNRNTADGYTTLFSDTTGNHNTATGQQALYSNTAGSYNTANGSNALYFNITGGLNTANGFQALYSNTTGGGNTADGVNALYFNTTGSGNMANSSYALYKNTTGSYNMASGYASLYNNTTGISNTAYGYESLYNNTTGNWNTAYGLNALLAVTTGNYNIGLGYGAGQNLTTGSNNITLANSGNASDNGVIRIGTVGTQGAAYIAGINGVTSSNGVPVYINAQGQLGTLTSSRRFKYDIQNLGEVSASLMDLRPVRFRYKVATAEGEHPIQYGLIAEEVAQVYPEMVQYDREGKPFTVYYQQLTPMMLNELQKAHREIAALQAGQQQTQRQEAEIRELRGMVQTLFRTLVALALAGVGLGALILASRIRLTR